MVHNNYTLPLSNSGQIGRGKKQNLRKSESSEIGFELSYDIYRSHIHIMYKNRYIVYSTITMTCSHHASESEPCELPVNLFRTLSGVARM